MTNVIIALVKLMTNVIFVSFSMENHNVINLVRVVNVP